MKTIIAVAVVLTLMLSMPASTQAAGSVGGSATFTCAQTEAQVAASGAARVSAGGSTIYTGYRQVSGNNQNPIVRSFGTNNWCQDTVYETSSDDGRAYGLWWDGSNLYVVFSATGTGTGSNYNVHTGSGWLNSYGAGGGGQVSVVLRLDPTTGNPTGGTYITARLTNGNSNSARTTGLTFTGSSLIVTLDSAFSPRNTDRSRMDCTNYPLTWTLELSTDLGSALGSIATNCNSTSPPPSQIPSGALAGGVGYLDGRLNAFDVAPPVAVYCNPRGIAVYSVSPVTSQGTLAFIAPADRIASGLADARSRGTNVEVISGDGAILYALRSNELQVNKFELNGTLYEFIFDADTCEYDLTTTSTSTTPTTTTTTPDPLTPPPISGDAVIHTVQPGENLFRIALRYGMNYVELGQINGIDPPYTIYVGDQIFIPAR